MIDLIRDTEPWEFCLCEDPERDVPTSRRDGPRMKTEKTELEGTFWVFAWPQLVPWVPKITWLFCPPTGGRRTGGCKWKGDLWGLDEEGNLLIVENKTIERIRKSRHDPFKEFPVDDTARAFEALNDAWIERVEEEERFRRTYPNGLPKEFPELSCPGQFDPSLGRLPCRRYPNLYKRTADYLSSDEYKRRATQNFCAYKMKRPAPHYFGLSTLFGDDEPILNDETHYRRLVEIPGVGEDHVRMFAVRRSSEDCKVYSYQVRFPAGW